MKVSNKKKSTISKVSNANTNVTSSSGSLTGDPLLNQRTMQHTGPFNSITTGSTYISPICGSISIGTISTNTTTNTWISYAEIPKVEITLLGKSFSVYHDNETLQIFSLIDFLGIEYYKSLKNMKLEHRLDEEIRDFLELESQIFERGQKIKKALNSDDKS